MSARRYWFAEVAYVGKEPFWFGNFVVVAEHETVAHKELQSEVDAAWAKISPHPGPVLHSVLKGRLIAMDEK